MLLQREQPHLSHSSLMAHPHCAPHSALSAQSFLHSPQSPLPPQQRTALTLKLGEDLKLSQIGEIMGKSEGAVKLLIHRGMTTLKGMLQAEPHEEGSPS